jgi:hypothetical protein
MDFFVLDRTALGGVSGDYLYIDECKKQLEQK